MQPYPGPSYNVPPYPGLSDVPPFPSLSDVPPFPGPSAGSKQSALAVEGSSCCSCDIVPGGWS